MDALPIPKPQVLDPHRRLVNDEDKFTANHEARAVLLQRALETSCAYADQLWNDLNAMRQYLLDCLPDPHTATGPVATGAAPSGPDDEHGWQNWMTAFAEVTSVLCGPHGDSGFGLSRAREEAQRRRASPAAAAPRDGNAELDTSPDAPKPPDQPHPEPQPRTADKPRTPPSQDAAPQKPIREHRRLARMAGMAVLIGLALRGLQPHPLRSRGRTAGGEPPPNAR